MLGQPTYLGPRERRLFAMVHVPPSVRAATIVCPPLGYEAVCAQQAMVRLAERLSEAGGLVLRLDYDGTGNSMGDSGDPDRVAAWRRSIHAAVEYLRESGVDRVGLVGLRFGATLAWDVAGQRDDVERLVLWDPVMSGRRHVRTMRVMAATSDYVDESGSGLNLAGTRFDDDTLAAMATMSVEPADTGRACLVVVSSDADGEAWQPVAEVRVMSGTAGLLDTDVELSVVPEPILDTVVEWERDHGAARGASEARPARSESAEEEVVRDGRRHAVHHSVARLERGDLFLTLSRPDGPPPSRAVVMLNNGSAGQIGPGRAWVAWARELAVDGFLVARADLSGLGESPVATGGRSGDSYPISAGEEIAEVVAAVRSEHVHHLATLGLCSGALLGFDGLIASHGIDTVVAINGRFDKAWRHPARDRPRRAAGRSWRPLAFLLAKGPLFPVFDRVPRWVWWLLDKTRLVPSPLRSFRAADRRDADVLLVFGPEEKGLRALRRRAGEDFEALLQRDRAHLRTVEGLDHSMFNESARDRVYAVVRDYLTAEPSSARQP